jgi:hypothetical protein
MREKRYIYKGGEEGRAAAASIFRFFNLKILRSIFIKVVEKRTFL